MLQRLTFIRDGLAWTYLRTVSTSKRRAESTIDAKYLGLADLEGESMMHNDHASARALRGI